ncbi:MAG: hypothetical protein IJA10_14775 [Lachnospiraceae bacterium]|nr:hypothetical protein [Lachnospiraceae bacterium]
MISYTTILFNEETGFEILLTIPEIKKYIDDYTIDVLNKHLKPFVSKIIVEFPYYDQDYLSTYYIHYAKKFKNYPKHCYRIHFIAEDNIYCGYTVLRPIVFGKKLGKTYLSPKCLLSSPAYLLYGEYKVHINGNEWKIKSFPWMMQDTDISICAHTAIWTILRYYGNQYIQYANPTLGDIIENVHEEWGRKTPSNGLTPVQVSDILTKHGFYPIIRGGDKDNIGKLLAEIMAYIESGIPIIAMSDSQQHAFSIIGHGEIEYDILDDPEYINKIKEPNTDIILHSKLINSMYIMDDNLFPFRKLDKYVTSKSDVKYSMYEITYAVVPLYSRMQLEYHEVYQRFLALLKYGDMKWKGKQITRIYLTSSDSLKSYIKKTSDILPDLKNIIVRMNMSKFVWCIDLSEIDEYKEGKVSGKIIIDATAGSKETEPWILMHNKEQIRYYDVYKDSYMEIEDVRIQPYTQYIHNLKPINT